MNESVNRAKDEIEFALGECLCIEELCDACEELIVKLKEQRNLMIKILTEGEEE